jgi:CRP/FNR family transcriptional regulator, cyclic AMP receptor protein
MSKIMTDRIGQTRAAPQTRLFTDIPEEVRRNLLGTAPAITLRKGQRLFERGDPGGTMYLVKTGRIEISMVTEAGRKISLNLMGPGDFFGEISLIDGRKRTASAVAVEAAVLKPITRQSYVAAISQSPQLAISFMETLCERLRWVSDSVEEYALLPLDRRLARRLLSLHDHFAGEDGAITIAQSDLADFAGATRESTNKILMQWKKAGFIALKRRAVFLTNKEGLDRLAYDGMDD